MPQVWSAVGRTVPDQMGHGDQFGDLREMPGKGRERDVYVPSTPRCRRGPKPEALCQEPHGEVDVNNSHCSICQHRYALAHPIRDEHDHLVPMCVECAASHSRPLRFAHGTLQGRPANDFADHAGSEQARLLEVAQARAERAVEMLRAMMRAFPEMATSLSTAPQQAVLRECRALLAEVS